MNPNADPRSQPAPTKTALLVEDEHSTLRFYMAGLRGLQEFRLLAAENGREALDLLERNPVDVVVTDLNMPVLDGYGLIAILAERYPSLPVIVITSVQESGLLEKIRAAGARPPEGIVQGLGLASLLQLLNWERQTATLTVRAPGGVGFLYVKEGHLVHAAFEKLEGLPAAYRILAWDGAHVEFVNSCRVTATIELAMGEVLMNAAVERDERNQATRTATPETWYD